MTESEARDMIALAERRTETEAAPLDLPALERLDKEATPGPWIRDDWDEWLVDGPGSYSAISMGLTGDAAPVVIVIGQGESEKEADANAALIAAVRTALPALIERARAAEWQPVETAPKDGTEFIYLRVSEGEVGRCRWDEGDVDDWPCWWDIDGDQEAHADYWMPLPSPPAGLLPKESERE